MDVDSNFSSCSADVSFVENFMAGEEVEDENVEWLSAYVEECFSQATPLVSSTTDSISTKNNSDQHQLYPNISLAKPPSQEDSEVVLLPITKSRSKRRRIPPKKFSDDSHHSFIHIASPSSSPDPLLHHQTCWLAESELLLPMRKAEDKAPPPQQPTMKQVCNEEEGSEDETRELQQQQQAIRRCAHCLSHKTPQWRAGPLGPKTLCNACGVSYKKGRLLPEYRPAKSPTFVSYKHSNSYKKVMEMRMGLMASRAK